MGELGDYVTEEARKLTTASAIDEKARVLSKVVHDLQIHAKEKPTFTPSGDRARGAGQWVRAEDVTEPLLGLEEGLHRISKMAQSLLAGQDPSFPAKDSDEESSEDND